MILRKEINIKWSSVKLSFYLNYMEEFKFFLEKLNSVNWKYKLEQFYFWICFFKRKRVFKIVYKLFKFIESNTKWSTVIFDGIFSRVLQFVFFHRWMKLKTSKCGKDSSPCACSPETKCGMSRSGEGRIAWFWLFSRMGNNQKPSK